MLLEEIPNHIIRDNVSRRRPQKRRHAQQRRRPDVARVFHHVKNDLTAVFAVVVHLARLVPISQLSFSLIIVSNSPASSPAMVWCYLLAYGERRLGRVESNLFR